MQNKMRVIVVSLMLLLSLSLVLAYAIQAQSMQSSEAEMTAMADHLIAKAQNKKNKDSQSSLRDLLCALASLRGPSVRFRSQESVPVTGSVDPVLFTGLCPGEADPSRVIVAFFSFRDEANFTRWFKQRTGRCLSAFREKVFKTRACQK